MKMDISMHIFLRIDIFFCGYHPFSASLTRTTEQKYDRKPPNGGGAQGLETAAAEFFIIIIIIIIFVYYLPLVHWVYKSSHKAGN